MIFLKWSWFWWEKPKGPSARSSDGGGVGRVGEEPDSNEVIPRGIVWRTVAKGSRLLPNFTEPDRSL